LGSGNPQGQFHTIALRSVTLGVSLALAACVTGGQPVQVPTARPGQVMLTGSYSVPEGKGPFPAVVLLHGGCNLNSETHVIDFQDDLAKVGIGSVAVDSWLLRGFFGPARSSGSATGPPRPACGDRKPDRCKGSRRYRCRPRRRVRCRRPERPAP